MLFTRLINLPKSPSKSFFLWGPRQAGKSFSLKRSYPEAYIIDLLDSTQLVRFSNDPSRLYQEVKLIPKDTLIIIDEVQKVPQLLDEVHRCIENLHATFCLCGSSARKLKRGQANLLGGRALRYEMFGLTSKELGEAFEIVTLCNRGNIPDHYKDEAYVDLLESYISDYLKEEILAESLVRNLPVFSDFLRSAAISDTEIVNYTNIASDCGVSSQTVKNYFEIMTDTLQGFFLPAYTRRPKRKIINAPKFYFANVGVVNHLAKRRLLEPGSELFGKAFENVIINEIRAWNSYKKLRYDLAYWKLTSGAEVDLVIEELDLALEIKSSSKITNAHLKGLRELRSDHGKFDRLIVVSLEPRSRKLEDGTLIYSLDDFLKALWENDLKC